MHRPPSEAGRATAQAMPCLARHPGFAPFIGSVAVTASPGLAFGLAAGPGTLAIGDGEIPLPVLRFGLELAWMLSVPDLPAAAALLLAGRAAGSFAALLPAGAGAESHPSMPAFRHLAGAVLPPIAQLAACWRMLADAAPGADAPPDLASLRCVERLWACAPCTEALLTQGGDERLDLDPRTARNRYLCLPWPEPDVIAFGSCTASSIAPEAFAAAEAARQDLFTATLADRAEDVLLRASDQIEAELLVHCGCEELAEAVLAASGTDATLLLTGLLAAEHPRASITTVLMSPAETGSGVPEAVQGRHFAASTAAGVPVEKGGAVEGFPPGLALVSVPLRDDLGLPRAPDDIAADCEAEIARAVQKGHVVLHAIDGSKTGLTAPHLLALDLLAARFGDALDIVVDACQMRIEPELIRGYLERGWPVLVTGSKFFAAPGFCGAVLFPRARLRRIAGAGRLPGGLGAYAQITGGSVSRRCAGLLLRWTAALSVMRRFGALPTAEIRAAIDTAGAQIRGALMRHPRFQLVPAPRPALGDWSQRPSVFTFTVNGSAGPLPPDALRTLYRSLAFGEAGTPCRLGQPVQLGRSPGGGLRVALSAAQIADGEDLRAQAGTAVEQLNRLAAG